MVSKSRIWVAALDWSESSGRDNTFSCLSENLRLAQLSRPAREVTVYKAHEIANETTVLALYPALSLVSLGLLTDKLMVHSKCSSRIIVQEMLEITTKLFSDNSVQSISVFLLFNFLFSTFLLLVPCGRLNWLMSAFERTLKQHLVGVSYAMAALPFCGRRTCFSEVKSILSTTDF